MNRIKDPVLADEAKHDRLSEAQEVLEEMGMEAAMDEFKAGDLDDIIQDIVVDEGRDITLIALWACYPEHFFQPACSMKDFRATVSGVITERARVLAGEK